jgi:endonuclease/exonuclease/phosphatase family metal-dependent hydrolase
MKTALRILVVLELCLLSNGNAVGQDLEKKEGSIRIATYNVALYRDGAGDLAKELASGTSKAAKSIAEVIQRVRPDIILLNEIDFDDGKSPKLLAEKYIEQPQNGLQPITYKHHFVAPVNTGVDTGLDLNQDGKKRTPDDAFGYGKYPGQYGMVVFSNFEIDQTRARTFQNFLWKDMPDAILPVVPDTKSPYYKLEMQDVFRLSSKSHWDLPIRVGERTIHFLVSHPTPPVFDGPEDRNGCRNHDEIRLWADYVGGRADYLYDDRKQRGGLPADANFVIAGDLNADPVDGASRKQVMQQLLNHERINSSFAPRSTGGAYWSQEQGQENKNHKGEPSLDTGDFSERVGNLRIDYVLPSKNLQVTGSGVFWPKPDEPGSQAVLSSDHRLVWIDVEQ